MPALSLPETALFVVLLSLCLLSAVLLLLQHRAHARELRLRGELQLAQEERLRRLAAEILGRESAELRHGNAEQVGSLLSPLRERLEQLDTALRATNSSAAGNRAALEEQLRALSLQTSRLGTEAEQLSRALRGDAKVQGDWGETMLESLLESSGLLRGQHFRLQADFEREGAHFRPDAVVYFPGERCVVVDAKVSLTAYIRYVNAESPVEREQALREHLLSVRRHVAELAEKDYGSLVPGAVGHVLLFMPHEAAYGAAVRRAPELPAEAYRRRVIIVSPTNLLMALQLADNLWHQEVQAAGVRDIISRATLLYEKLAGVQEAFLAARDKLRAAEKEMDIAEERLSRGKGSYARQVELLRDCGVKPKRKLKLPEEPAEGDEAQQG